MRFPALWMMRLQCDAAYVNWAPKLKMSKTRLVCLSGYEVLGDGPKSRQRQSRQRGSGAAPADGRLCSQLDEIRFENGLCRFTGEAPPR